MERLFRNFQKQDLVKFLFKKNAYTLFQFIFISPQGFLLSDILRQRSKYTKAMGKDKYLQDDS